MTREFTRRRVLALSAATTSLVAMPALVRAQAQPIKIGTLTPLTGSGGQYGPVMANVVKAIADQVNAAGGVLGRQVQIVSEDDQTNAEAGVRAARKLIDVDKVSAILGTWASAVTTAVAPLCWESKTFLFTVSGADSITQLPHNGWLARTQPNTTLQGRKFAEFCLEVSGGGKKAYFMMPQTPFTQSTFANFKAAYDKVGGATELLIYDDKKPSLRTEVDQAMRFAPDVIFVGGYLTDTTVLMRDLYRAGFKGKIVGPGYSINQKLSDAVGQAEAVEGAYGMLPSPQEGSNGWKRVVDLTKQASPDPFSCQTHDHVSLALLAMAAGKDASGQGIRDNLRKVSQGGGDRIDDVVEGLKAITAGRKIDFDGASGPCDFTDLGDITEVKFRYEQIKAGKATLVRIGRAQMISAFVQAVLNGIVSGTILAVPAIGFTAIFAMLRYPNFAIGSLATIGAYGGWWANTRLGLPMEASLGFAFAAAAVAALIAEELAVRPLERSGALIMAIASLAVGIVLENLVRFAFGNEPRGFNVPLMRDMRFGDLRISPQQMENFAIALAIMAALWLGLRFTRMGMAMRASADNPDLARLKGVDPALVAMITIAIAGGLAGVGGMLVALDTAADPLTGFRLILSVFAAAVLGGLGSIPGAVAGALLIGIIEELTVLMIAPNYRTAIGFVVILIVLTLRPSGLFGAKATA